MALPTHVDHLIVGSGFAGPVRGDQAGRVRRDRLRRHRARPRRGRHVARQHLSRCVLRHPEPALLVLVRPQPRVDLVVLPQPEIQEYLRGVARDYDLLSRTVFDTELEQAVWDDEAQVWRCRTTSGEVVAKTLITGTGGLSEPRLPDIEGIGSFGGALFHSARWDHSVDLAGKRVAVIGTGASAIQIVPEVQKVASHLDVYQRTAPWVIPRNDRRYSKARAARPATRAGPGDGSTAPASTGPTRATCRRSPGSRGSARRPRRPRRST